MGKARTKETLGLKGLAGVPLSAEGENMRSDIIKKGLERVPHRALLHATGLSRKDLDSKNTIQANNICSREIRNGRISEADI